MPQIRIRSLRIWLLSKLQSQLSNKDSYYARLTVTQPIIVVETGCTESEMTMDRQKSVMYSNRIYPTVMLIKWLNSGAKKWNSMQKLWTARILVKLIKKRINMTHAAQRCDYCDIIDWRRSDHPISGRSAARHVWLNGYTIEACLDASGKAPFGVGNGYKGAKWLLTKYYHEYRLK